MFKAIFLKERLKMPIQVMIHATNICNARCETCYNWRNLNRGNELSLGEYEKISKSMKNFKWLLIGGGEPLLREDIVEICKLFNKNNKVRHITISTNGLNSEDIVNKVEEILKSINGVLMFSLSLDGLRERHDSLRGVPGNFDRLMKTYDGLKDLRRRYNNLSLKFHTVVNNKNIDELDSIIEFVKTKKVDIHTFDFLRGEPMNSSVKAISLEECKKVVEKVKNVYGYYKGYNMGFKGRIAKAILFAYLDLFLKLEENKKQVIPCYAGRINAFIDAEGNVSLCEIRKVFANLRDYDYDFLKLWSSDKANKERKNMGCWCIHPCYQTSNMMFNPRYYYKLVDSYFRS